MSARPPVKDWTTDFDHTDPRWLNDPFPLWDELRGRCPVARSERFEGGAYFPSRYHEVREIAYDTEHFSSRRVIVRDKKIEPPFPSPPITSDPPAHRLDRMPLLPPFNPKAVAKLQPGTRELCERLIERFIGAGRCDAATDYAQHIPTRVIAHMLGVPEDDGDRFRHWIKMALEVGIYEPQKTVEAIIEMTAYFKEQIAKRQGRPGEDLISYVRDLQLEGKPVPEEKRIGALRLILIAGIDTTWSAIGASLWHLATHDGDRRRLAADPSLMDTAVEELLRAYAPVTMAREVVKEVTIGGCPMKPGGMVLLSFPAANRDPAVFTDADKVLLDRKENRHAAFGLGIHRCIGSNLARMELRTALEVWLERIPEFRLESGSEVKWSTGTVRGPRQLPVVFG